MFEQEDYIEKFEEEAEQEKTIVNTETLNTVLTNGISVLAVLVALYTTVHGISATLTMQAGGFWGAITGVLGIIVLEALFLIVTHGLIHGVFKGCKKHIGLMAFSSLVALIFMIANTVLDAHINSGMALGSNLSFYFAYILPIAGVVSVVIAMVGQYFSPSAERDRKRSEAVELYRAQRFNSGMAAKRTELEMKKVLTNAQLGARITAAKIAAKHYQSPKVRKQIEAAALNAVPDLLRQIGVVEHEEDEVIIVPPQPNGKVKENFLN